VRGLENSDSEDEELKAVTAHGGVRRRRKGMACCVTVPDSPTEEDSVGD
jgi:hypothetical protein